MRPAGWIPCPDLRTARSVSGTRSGAGGASGGSPWCLSLDGEWDFELLERPDDLTIWQLLDGELSSRSEVPGAWTMDGHGNPIYTNVVMPFPGEPPAVPDDNPTAVYRRTFEVPVEWEGRRVLLQVGSAESIVMVYCDGEFVGFGTDSRLASEFDLTPFTAARRPHTLALVVPRWSVGTWLEDQDQWFHGGLQRSVSLISTAATRISTARITGGLAGVPRGRGRPTTGTLDVDLLVEGPACSEAGWSIDVVVETMRGGELARSGSLEVPHWDDSEMFLSMAGSMFTEAGRVRTNLEVPAISPWSAEQPALYRTVVTLRDPSGEVVEVDALRVGFRKVEVADRKLLINGVPVVLRGVNVHEHDPNHGRAVSPEHTLADLRMIKAANLNAVRASHYPHGEHFAALCDELGLYIVDEANVESHARQWSLCHDSRFDSAVLARVVRMAERDHHHPSVIMWSLGNESGYGQAHDAAAAMLRRIDPSRPLHYEGPFMFDLAAEAPVSDIVCPMYTPVPEIIEWSERSEDQRRPLILCEYSHAMGNACGGLTDYDDAFESRDGLQGGFIWEWCEHGIPTPDGARGPTGAPSWGYAGDFGDNAQEGNFVLDGLVGAGRAPHPVLEEVRYLGRPVRASLLGTGPGRAEVELVNQRWFTDTSDLVGSWELSMDGEPVSAGALPARPLAPRQALRTVLRWRRALQRADGEYHLTLRWRLRARSSWAPRGHVVGWEQFSIPVHGNATNDPATASGSSMSGRSDIVADVGTHRSHRRRSGGQAAGFVPFDFEPSIFRALTDNDGIRAGWMRTLNGSLKRWVDQLGLDRCVWDPDAGTLQPDSAVPPLRVDARLSAAGGSWQRMELDFELPEELADPPRLGAVWKLPADLEYLEFFAEGPGDCYPDRRSAALSGRWRSTVSDEYVDYGMPQEHGHHTGLRWVALRTRRSGPGLMVVAECDCGFSARHHSDGELWGAMHTGDLRPLSEAEHTWLSVDIAQRGLGQSSLGPETLDRYRIPAGHHRLTLLIRDLVSHEDPSELYRRRLR